jgi:hypothetical protein
MGCGVWGVAQSSTASTVLLVTILNTRDTAIKLEHVCAIFQPYGRVLRVILFVKQNLLKVCAVGSPAAPTAPLTSSLLRFCRRSWNWLL